MDEPLNLTLDRVDTPIGEMLIVTDERARLRALDWHDFEARMRRLLRLHYGEHGIALSKGAAPASMRAALQAYFDGHLSVIEALPVATAGTPFQREIWAALRRIPVGQTRSYGELAKQIGRPAAVRAVGLANGANPIGLVVPCHRVIGADRSLTGYAGGLARKRWLLAHEGASFAPAANSASAG
ncbi:MAG TPA: methylated-DNA--[protein]-cysteine S-methyltransferase [Polyangiales bacterium]|jgi:methylated-DNA-[protein]-cysteine S-methyltransferase